LFFLFDWLKRHWKAPSRAEVEAALDEFLRTGKHTRTIADLCDWSPQPNQDELAERIGDELRYMIWRSKPLPTDVVKERVQQMLAE
jgi:hypothetical protein